MCLSLCGPHLRCLTFLSVRRVGQARPRRATAHHFGSVGRRSLRDLIPPYGFETASKGEQELLTLATLDFRLAACSH